MAFVGPPLTIRDMSLSQLLQITYALTPLISWLLNVFAFRRRIHWFVLFILACIAGYVILMLAVQVVEAELERELYRHDVDGDGAFSENEITADAERAMDAVSSDTGRTFAPITGVPITFVWTSLNFITISVIDWLARVTVRIYRQREFK